MADNPGKSSKKVVNRRQTRPSPGPTDERAPHERLLDRATTAAQLKEPGRRWAIRGLIRERWRVPISGALSGAQPAVACTAADILYAGYGDSDGRAYWDAWLFEKMSVREIATLLATHVADSEERFQRTKADLQRVLESAGEKEPRDAVEWLLRNPNTRHLVPESLGRYLQSACTKTAELASSPHAPTAVRDAAGIPRRAPGLNYAVSDGPLVLQMKELVDTGKALNPWRAALIVSEQAEGGGMGLSKARRLLKRFSEAFSAERDGKD